MTSPACRSSRRRRLLVTRRARPWPNGDLVEKKPLPAGVTAATLQAASDWAFKRESPEQVTLSLLIVHRGQIIHERYAPGVDMTTRTRTWSTAKSIAATLFGILADQGKLTLDAPLGFDWLPQGRGAVKDPRSAITLRHVLNMSSGLETVDNGGLEYATGSGMSYWAGASSVEGARNRGLIREPGTSWDYENYDTLLAVYAMKRALKDPQRYLEFPRKALFDRIGMRNTLLSTDRFGDFILSSQVYTNARDLARLGLLYLNGGIGTVNGSSRRNGSTSCESPRRPRRSVATSTAAIGGSCPTTGQTSPRMPIQQTVIAANLPSSCPHTTWSSSGAVSITGARGSTSGTWCVR